jgi:hypothetical protein
MGWPPASVVPVMRWIWAAIFILFALATLAALVLSIAKALGLIA